MQEQAKAIEELIAALTDTHTLQMETLIKSAMDTRKEMMLLIKENKNPTTPTNKQMKRRKRRGTKKVKNTMTCQSVSNVARNNYQRIKMNAGSWRRNNLAHQRESQPKAPEDVRGPK
jgi:hypothetical protein